MIGERQELGNLVGCMNMNKRFKKDELIKFIEELNLEKCDFTLLSSSALVFRGIMDDAGDLDIAVTDEGFNKLNQKFKLKAKGNSFYTVNDNCECIIDAKEGIKELVDNIYVQDIYNYLEYLYSSEREKDKLRISLVLSYIREKIQYENISKQNEFFIEILKRNTSLMKVLDFIDKLNLSNYYIAAGSVFQTIWNYFDDVDLNNNIKDIDVIYYDNTNLDVNKDIEICNKIVEFCNNNDLNYEIDVSNEARMHLWKKVHENKNVEQYKNSEDAINHWIANIHAIGITKINNEIKVYAPFGLSDIYSRTIRPIKHKYNSKELYDKKVKSWSSRFDNLNIVEW